MHLALQVHGPGRSRGAPGGHGAQGVYPDRGLTHPIPRGRLSSSPLCSSGKESLNYLPLCWLSVGQLTQLYQQARRVRFNLVIKCIISHLISDGSAMDFKLKQIQNLK